MVFGWGKKKQEEQWQQNEHVQDQVRLSEIESMLQKNKEVRQAQIVHQAKPRFETIKKELRLTLSIADNLKNDDLKLDDVDTRLRVIVTRGKKDVVETISKEAAVDLPKIDSYESVVKCAEVSSHALKKIGDVLGKNTRIIHIFAKKYANDLKLHLETLSANHSDILKLLKGISDFESNVAQIKEEKARLESTEDEAAEKKSNLEKFKESLQQHHKTISELEDKISVIMGSSDYEQFLKSKKSLESVLNDETRLYKEIDDEFSKISRPLGKYVYVTSLEKHLKVLLEDLVKSAAKTITRENKDAVITVLESCMKGVMSGTVSVKENDKTVDQITHLISNIDSLIEKKSQHEIKIKKIMDAVNSFDSGRLADLQKQLDVAREDRDHAELKIKTLESEIEQLGAQGEDIVQQIADLINKAVGTRPKILR